MKTVKTGTYWVYECYCLDGETPRALVTSPHDTLSKALASAFEDVTYYIGACSYKVGVSFQERCAACDGCGHVVKRTKRTRKELVCKACKGNPVIQELPMTRWTPSENVRISDVLENAEAEHEAEKAD